MCVEGERMLDLRGGEVGQGEVSMPAFQKRPFTFEELEQMLDERCEVKLVGCHPCECFYVEPHHLLRCVCEAAEEGGPNLEWWVSRGSKYL